VSTSFIERAEAAMRGESAPEVELYPGEPATVLDVQGRRALLAPLFAGFMWAAAIFFEIQSTRQFAPAPLLLRLLALALSVRALLLGAELLQRLAISLRHGRYQLALADEGLLLRTPQADYAVPKHDIIDVRERGAWQEHTRGRWSEVYIVLRPSAGRTHIALPPLFARSPGVLAERLMRWRGVVEAPESPAPHDPVELPSKLFDAAASGEVTPGCCAIKLRNEFLQRGPHATVLLGVALLAGYLRLPAPQRALATPVAAAVLALCLGVVPLGWWLLARARSAPRKGIALLLTPAELLTRSRAGVHRMRWSELARAEVASRTVWSMLRGPHETRALVLQLKDRSVRTFDEAALAAPAEVAASLCEGYRKGVLP
jgi:hypothetical protein